MAKNPISYSVRDFAGILSQFAADATLKNMSSILQRAIAGTFDVLNNTLNAVANSLLLRTSYNRPYIQDLLALIGYNLSWKTTSQYITTLTIKATATQFGSYTVTAANLVFQTPATLLSPALQFESRTPVTLSIGTTTTSITLYQQKSVSAAINIGTTSGISGQTINLPDKNILAETLTLSINSITYTKVNSFVNSLNTDKVFMLYFRSDGTSYIKLGVLDSQTSIQYGFIPPANIAVFATYAIGGGASSNVTNPTNLTYIGADTNVISSSALTTPQVFGTDEESIDNAKNIAPMLLRSAQYYVNEASGTALVLSIPGIQLAQLVKTGVPSITAFIMPIGGGVSSGALKTLVQTTLVNASFLQSAVVTVQDIAHVKSGLNILVAILPGYSYNSIWQYVALAAIQRCHFMGKYIMGIYNSQGVASTITAINTYYASLISGYTFSSTTQSDIDAVNRIYQNVNFQNPGDDFIPEEIEAAVAFVQGVDYTIVTNPSSTIAVPAGSVFEPILITLTQI